MEIGLYCVRNSILKVEVFKVFKCKKCVWNFLFKIYCNIKLNCCMFKIKVIYFLIDFFFVWSLFKFFIVDFEM